MSSDSHSSYEEYEKDIREIYYGCLMVEEQDERHDRFMKDPVVSETIRKAYDEGKSDQEAAALVEKKYYEWVKTDSPTKA